jgi:hypothetical protein
VRDSRRETSDLLRSVGGLLLAAGAVVLLIRKSSHHEWSNLARLLVVLLPAAALYLLALSPSAGRPGATDGRSWRAVLLVTAMALVPLVLLLFLRLVGASTTDRLSEAGVFALTAVLAGYGAHRARVSYAALLAGLALVVAWLLVWSEILSHPSGDAYRWLLVAAAVLLLAGAAWLARGGRIGAGELATAGGLAAIAAGILGVIAGLAAGALRAITSLGETGGSSTSAIGSTLGPGRAVSPQLNGGRASLPIHVHIGGLQRFGWDLYLLLVALALVWLASRARLRGPGYVGALGLLAFVVSVGLQVTRLELGRATSSELVGWPLALLILGLAGLLAPALDRRAD